MERARSWAAAKTKVKHEQLVAAVRSHETWVQSSGASGTQISMADADLRNSDLRGYCLCEAMLPGANLCGVQMQRLDFFGANLASATLIGAQLELAQLGKATLDYANFSGANLAQAKLMRASCLESNFDKAVLAGADLRHVVFSRALMRGATELRPLRWSDLSES